MRISFSHNSLIYSADLSQPMDISIPIRNGLENPNCFWAPAVEFSPVVAGSFVGSTAEGGSVNFFNIKINPHGNGTHTECVGHISKERFTIRECLKGFHFFAKVVSIYPQRMDDGDRIITLQQIREILSENEANALVIRTLPNDELKKTTNYSGANAPYLHHEAVKYMVDCQIEHLLLDLPSIDKEDDGGKLLGHRAFWQYPEAIRQQCTVTEMVYVPPHVKDGYYLLNLQTASFDLDVSPSKPVLFVLD